MLSDFSSADTLEGERRYTETQVDIATYIMRGVKNRVKVSFLEIK